MLRHHVCAAKIPWFAGHWGWFAELREAYGAQEGLVYENEGEASLRIDA